MAILVTGGAGYIGSVTVERLRANNEDVVVLDDLVYGHRDAVGSDVHFYQGKVGDLALLARIAGEHKIDACVHFAALTSVGESVTEPAKYFQNNVEQGIALMGFLIRVGVRIVVFSSTCATYGEPKEVPISEKCPQWPKNPYGWSKFCMERFLESYDLAYGLRFMALRYFNAAGATEKYGEDHDPESHLIPNVLAAAAEKNRRSQSLGIIIPHRTELPFATIFTFQTLRMLTSLHSGTSAMEEAPKLSMLGPAMTIPCWK